MPWKKCSVMDEKLQFVARRLADGGLCGKFGISRKTGHKIFDGHQGCGLKIERQEPTTVSVRPATSFETNTLKLTIICRQQVVRPTVAMATTAAAPGS
jgi:hypothetical protein